MAAQVSAIVQRRVRDYGEMLVPCDGVAPSWLKANFPSVARRGHKGTVIAPRSCFITSAASHSRQHRARNTLCDRFLSEMKHAENRGHLWV
jgi:hypothetical protein